KRRPGGAVGESLISVVIPSYNCGNYVTAAVDSVLAQSRPADQVIVIDGGSRDDTADRLRPYAGRVEYVRQDNGGVSTARNHGIQRSNGDLIAFLDADDVWHPRKLEFQVAALAARPDLSLLGTDTFGWPNVAPPETLPDSPVVREVAWED